jgi:hypothetical protein
MAQVPATPRWKVVSQVQQSGQLPGGRFGPGMAVTYQLDTGTTGTVFVPLSAYNPANVTAAINAQAPSLATVDGLTSEG